MAHDEHFLSRLDRVNRTQMDFALSLYRDHQTVRWVLDRARIPQSADRVAIAIDEVADGIPPHVIVARDGGFVTCLARGMSVGACPRIGRNELDRLVGESREFRDRWAKLQNEDSIAWFCRRLIAAGPRISREDFLPYVQIAPILENTYLRLWVKSIQRLAELLDAAIREWQRPYVREPFLREFWNEYYVAEHMTVLTALNPALFDRMVEAQAANDDAPLLAFFYWVARFGMLSSVTRVLWAFDRVGTTIRAEIIRQHLDGGATTGRLIGSLGLTVLSLNGDQEIRRIAAEHMPQARQIAAEIDAKDRNPPWVSTLFHELASIPAKAHTDPTRFRREAFDTVQAHWINQRGEVRARQELPDDDPDHLVPAVLGSSGLPLLESSTNNCHALMLASPHLVRGVRAEMLYPPKKLLDDIVEPYSWDRMRQMLSLPILETPRKVPVRKEEVVGRNDPCACGSGKKHKKCCG